MTDNSRAGRVSDDLAELKAALRELPLPPAEETAMRSAFRARQRALAAAAATRASMPTRRLVLAAAASVLVAIAAVVVVVGTGEPRPEPPPVAETGLPAPATADGLTAFQPLMYSPGFTPDSSYNVVRVRIPLSALALVPGTAADGMIEAELLIGDDGLARGIRFNPADAMLAAAAAQQ